MPNGYVAIVGSVLSEQMDKAGLAIKLPQFAVWADENGLLQRRKAGGSSYFMNMRFDEAIHRVLVINIDGISTPEDSTGLPSYNIDYGERHGSQPCLLSSQS